MQRPGMQELLGLCEEGRIDRIVAFKLDRVSRSILDFYDLMEILQKNEVDLESLNDALDTSTPVGRMVINLLLSFAQFERELIQERTKEAMDRLASEGRIGGGFAPLGYDRVDKSLVLNEEEARIVREIFNRFIAGELPIQIARDLNSRGLRTKQHHNKNGAVGGRRFTANNIYMTIQS